MGKGKKCCKKKKKTCCCKISKEICPPFVYAWSTGKLPDRTTVILTNDPVNPQGWACFKFNLPGFDPTTGIFTVPHSGLYQFSIYAAFQGFTQLTGNTYVRMRRTLAVNVCSCPAPTIEPSGVGSTNPYENRLPSNAQSIACISGTLPLITGDKLQIEIYQENNFEAEVDYFLEWFIFNPFCLNVGVLKRCEGTNCGVCSSQGPESLTIEGLGSGPFGPL